MKRFFSLSIVCTFLSCTEQKTCQYFYDDGYYHLDKSCKANGDEDKAMVLATDVYKNTYKVGAEYMQGEYGTHNVYFCSHCISEKQMNLIQDSITKYHDTDE